jgi:hypothetical protein
VKKWTQETSGKCWSMDCLNLSANRFCTQDSDPRWTTFGTVYPGISWWQVLFCFSFPDGFLQTFQIAKQIQAEGSGLQCLSLFLAFWQDQFLADFFPGDRSLKDPVRRKKMRAPEYILFWRLLWLETIRLLQWGGAGRTTKSWREVHGRILLQFFGSDCKERGKKV